MRRRFMRETAQIFDVSNYMTIEALEDNIKIVSSRAVEYGIDGVGWKKSKSEITAQKGELVSLKYKISKGESFGTIVITGRCNLKGNCLSLCVGDKSLTITSLEGYPYVFDKLFTENKGIVSIDKDFLPATTLSSGCYNLMFDGCTSLTAAPALPATTLAYGCYSSMFTGCTSLTTAPELPATTLAERCYNAMFIGCTSLTTAPELPATTLAERCYSSMFYGCTRLNYIKMLATDISASSCLSNWVYNVASAGTFVKNKNATWNVTGVNGVPGGWTIQKV